MFDQILASFDGAFSENTIKSYKSDFKQYEAWCQRNGYTPTPPEGAQIAAWIDDMSDRYKSSTIRRRIDSLRSLSYLAGYGNPTKDPAVTLALKRMHRKIGRAQDQATPLIREYLDKMIRKCNNSNLGLRNKVLLLLGYETMRRRSEICSFRFEDLTTLPNGNHALNLRRSKTDQFGKGRLIPISATLYKLIKKWEKRVGQPGGFILRSVNKSGAISESLVPASIPNILVDLQYRAGLRKLPNFSGHSFRVGAALDLLNRGVPMEKIMLRGGWSSNSTVLRYLQTWIGDEIDML